MNKLWIIARKDIREAFHSRSTYIFILILAVLTFSYFSSYRTLINNLHNLSASAQDIIEASQVFLNNLAYVLPMIYSIFVCSIFATYSVIVDKAKRNIESLMATPISLNQIWMGKSLAVTLPSILIGIGVAVIAFLVINLALIIPQTGHFLVPSAIAIFTALILAPILTFVVVTVVVYVQLIISNPRIANLVFTGIFLLLFFGVNILGSLGIGISLYLVYLGFIALGILICLFLSRSLTKEKVLLSSKG